MGLKEQEYNSLRTEILQWHNRRLVVFNITIILLIAYIGWILGLDISTSSNSSVKNPMNLSWQIVATFLNLIIATSIQLSRIFEIFAVKISSFLAVFHQSVWENVNRKILVEKKILKFSLNMAYSLIYLITAVFATMAFDSKFNKDATNIEWAAYLISATLMTISFITLFALNFDKKKEALINDWKGIQLANGSDYPS